MSTPDTPAPASQAPTDGTKPGNPGNAVVREAVRKARASLARYRFMALVTGVMLLILCVEMLYKYALVEGLGTSDALLPYISWIPYAHGWIYVLYLVTVVDLWSKMRWSLGRLVTMVLAGVVPVMSFVLEKKVHAEADAKLTALEQRV
ncbi:integral membrane protein [Sediminihabitans luteus]|uniref:Integral membrane protein n=1 Tax=Sediminihabitans luteus TaxID=1138585 RepID=A0A2M9CZ24_9CELL|nr:DUF3817 domain-containing protein [Sediminihabitans luteus]PJJ77186.1 integral membrane protein [Sediminihabitans luteus]GII98634.1 hypothetical protein Slu03_10120 [Sediminihabitans luteus]